VSRQYRLARAIMLFDTVWCTDGTNRHLAILLIAPAFDQVFDLDFIVLHRENVDLPINYSPSPATG
jgi:hypothetical protein